MVQFASYLRRVLCKTRLIFPRINGPTIILDINLITVSALSMDANGRKTSISGLGQEFTRILD